MSLLGRLEDLSLTDIIQIVFLSRRTGILEIVDGQGRHTVLFHHGLIVNASAPHHPGLAEYLSQRGLIPADSIATMRTLEESGIPLGTAALEMNLITRDDLAAAIKERILAVVSPLLQSREGEFNFLLAEAMQPVDVEYEPDLLFKEGGLSPQKILGSPEGEKLKPLRGLEESLKAGKALVRSAPEAYPSLDLGLGASRTTAPAIDELPADALPTIEVAAPPAEAASPPRAVGAGDPGTASQPRSGHFKVAGGLFEIESPEGASRNVILFERNPLIRVAAKRAFGKTGVKIQQFGSIDEARDAATEFFRSNRFFVTYLESTEDEAALRLMQQIKRRNPRLPVVIVDQTADLRRRHDVLRRGADLYLTKPAAEKLQPEMVEEELALFADELVLFADRAFEQWAQMTGGGADAGKRFYEQADKENMERSFTLLKQLINEVSNPNDIDQVAATILRLAAEYLDRGVLFVASETEFSGLGGFGADGAGDDLSVRARHLRMARHEPSILSDVVATRETHRGKIRRTAANEELMESLGGLLPTEVVAFPIMHADRAIGILYGDNAEHRAPIDSLTGLEIFLSQAGYAFGNAAAASGRGG